MIETLIKHTQDVADYHQHGASGATPINSKTGSAKLFLFFPSPLNRIDWKGGTATKRRFYVVCLKARRWAVIDIRCQQVK